MKHIEQVYIFVVQDEVEDCEGVPAFWTRGLEAMPAFCTQAKMLPKMMAQIKQSLGHEFKEKPKLLKFTNREEIQWECLSQ